MDIVNACRAFSVGFTQATFTWVEGEVAQNLTKYVGLIVGAMQIADEEKGHFSSF